MVEAVKSITQEIAQKVDVLRREFWDSVFPFALFEEKKLAFERFVSVYSSLVNAQVPTKIVLAKIFLLNLASVEAEKFEEKIEELQ